MPHGEGRAGGTGCLGPVSRVELGAEGGIWICATSCLLLLMCVLPVEEKSVVPGKLLAFASSELSGFVPFVLIDLLYLSCRTKSLRFFWYFKGKQ